MRNIIKTNTAPHHNSMWPEMTKIEVIRKIEKNLKESRFTKTEFAEMLEISVSQLNNILGNKSEISLIRTFQIVELLNISLSEIFDINAEQSAELKSMIDKYNSIIADKDEFIRLLRKEIETLKSTKI